MERLKIFTGSSYPELAEGICDNLGVALSPTQVNHYNNGCFEVILGDNVRGCSVFLIQTSLPNSHLLHYHLFELEQMINAAHKSSAREVTVVMPHFSYARSDRKWTGRMPIVVTLLAEHFKTAGMKRMLGMDFHSPQVESAFSTLTVVDHLEAFPLFVRYLRNKRLAKEKSIILPGDEGFHKKAERLGQCLGIKVGSVEKTRLDAERVKIGAIHGRLKGKHVIVYDDEILTAGTMAEIIRRIERKGALGVIIVATHALFQGRAIENLASPVIEEIVVTDTVPISPEAREKLPLTVISVAPLLAKAIREIYEGGSVSKLFQVPEEDEMD
jgi:ribose-phosphate pyrophosphokinase